MISLTYSCTCGFKTAILTAAQEHADQTQHIIDIRGSLTAQKPPKADTAIEKSARDRALRNAILRAARDRGLIKGLKLRKMC